MKSYPPRVLQPSEEVRQTGLTSGASAVHLQSNLALGSGAHEEGLDLREVWRKLWRGRRLIILVTVFGTLLGVAAALQFTPTFTAASTIMLETRQPQVFEAEAVLPSLVVDEDIIEGEIEVIYSRELARQVAARLDLTDNPEFNPDLQTENEGGWLSIATSWAAQVETKLREIAGDSGTEQVEATSDANARAQRQVVDALIENLEVGQIGESPVIRVSYTSENPRTAAQLANNVAQSYIGEQLELKSRETRQASQWLKERVADLRADVQEKEHEIENLRSAAGILEGGDDDISVATQQMSELASERVRVIMERQAAESQLQRNLDGELLASPVIQDLLLREEELSRQISQRSVEYGPNHPVMLNLQESLRGLRRSFSIERERVLAKLRSEVESARQRESELERSLEELSNKMRETNEQQVAIRALERDVSASRTMLENFLARAQETAQQEQILQPDARIISFAEVPDYPSFPNKKLIVLLAFCGSAFAGVSITYLVQSLDNSFQTAAQVRDALGMQVLQLVPELRRRFGHVDPVSYIVDEPHSGFAEAFRNLYVTLFAVRNPPKVVLFTSSLPGEGKTSMTLALGQMLASTGRSVLVIDCDLRKSTVHRVMNGEPVPGLAEHVRGEASLDEIIQKDPSTDLAFIAAGVSAGDSLDLLSSQAMHMAISKLARRFDVVLLDSAPLLAVADARVLQPYADKAVFVVRWRSTPQSAAKEAIRIVEESAFPFSFAGVVLNAVDMKSYTHYDDGIYYKSVKSYYRD